MVRWEGRGTKCKFEAGEMRGMSGLRSWMGLIVMIRIFMVACWDILILLRSDGKLFLFSNICFAFPTNQRVHMVRGSSIQPTKPCNWSLELIPISIFTTYSLLGRSSVGWINLSTPVWNIPTTWYGTDCLWHFIKQAKMIIHASDTNIKHNPNFVIFISSDETDGDSRAGIVE